MIYLEGQSHCQRVCEHWTEPVNPQRVSHFLNHGQMDIEQLSHCRINPLLPLAMKHQHHRQDGLSDYRLFSIDPSGFKKYKNKRMQGVHYTKESGELCKAHTFVMSSFIYGHSGVPFKKSWYWGKKRVPNHRRITKAQLYLKLARKAEKVSPSGKIPLAVFDGAGCQKNILPYFHQSPYWKGFVCQFPRTRNVIVHGPKIHIRSYLEQLQMKDFQSAILEGKEVLFHAFNASVPSLDSLEIVRLIVWPDEKGNLNQKTL